MILPTHLTVEEIYGAAAAAGARPDPLLTISLWADRYHRLSQRASAEHGRWRTERTPYLREIMDCLSPSSLIERVVLIDHPDLVDRVKYGQTAGRPRHGEPRSAGRDSRTGPHPRDGQHREHGG